jgi:hypothetical protein
LGAARVLVSGRKNSAGKLGHRYTGRGSYQQGE